MISIPFGIIGMTAAASAVAVKAYQLFFEKPTRKLPAKNHDFTDFPLEWERPSNLDELQAVIESAAPLNDETANAIVLQLKRKYGEGLTAEFRVVPELIGGMRITIGSDVWDGSISGRAKKTHSQFRVSFDVRSTAGTFRE